MNKGGGRGKGGREMTQSKVEGYFFAGYKVKWHLERGDA